MSKVINWNQFKIKDAKPNLIKNGWDDFEPYGSGKNYVENWNFEGDMDIWNFEKTKNNTVILPDNVWIMGQSVSIEGKCVVRLKVKAPSGRTRVWIQRHMYEPELTVNSVSIGDTEEPKWHIIEKEINFNNVSRVIIYCSFNPVEIDWIQITPIDNQHLVVEKTPLGNGLTRIQTWGGSENGKLRFIANSEKEGEPLSLSIYIENNGDDISLHHDAPSTNNVIEKGYKGFFETKTEVSVGKYKYIGIRTEGDLDFVASEPQFVEGDKVNPALVVKELDDGREHVKIYGATPDTTLVYEEKGFKGDLYSFSTEIENQGAYLEMESSIGNYREEIPEGTMELRHEGNLSKPQIEFKVGASDE